MWGGISKRGATQTVFFKSNMTATRYTTILDAALLPFVQTSFAGSPFRFYQDNDPKHTSRWAQWYFNEHDINWWRTPPESPDLNPIELVWGSMKEAIRNQYKPRTLPQLEDGIKHYWLNNIPPAVCCNYISRVLPAVVEAKGQATGF